MKNITSLDLFKYLWILFVLPLTNSFGQGYTVTKERFPSYFGLQVRPVLPTRFIGTPNLTLTNKEFSTTISQKTGYSFGATVRAGLTKLMALETGMNFTQRNYHVSMSVADSNISGINDLSFIAYDIPLNALVYIRLSEKFYMNTSLGAALIFKPSSVGILTLPGGNNSFTHEGVVTSKGAIDFNANVGFEYRTDKSGFFYLGGSARVPFQPLFMLFAQYKYDGYKNKVSGTIDGTYLSIDLKYFFPNIRNRGTPFQKGPIE